MKGVSQVTVKDQSNIEFNEQVVVIDSTETKIEASPQELKVTQVTQHVLATIDKDTGQVDVSSDITTKISKRKREEEQKVVEVAPEKIEPALKVVKKEPVLVTPDQKKDVIKVFEEWSSKLYKTLSWLQTPVYYVVKTKFETKVNACKDWDHLVETLNNCYQVIKEHKSQLSEAGQKLLPELDTKLKEFISVRTTP